MDRPNPADIAKLWTPDGVHELRIPDAGRYRTIAGYFDNPVDFANAAARHDRDGHPGIYLTINPVERDLLARSANQTQTYAKLTTGDKNIARRRWLIIDLDPIRPAGIPSTDAEHRIALARANIIDGDLHDAGWPEPLVMDSGNGAYLLYRIDLPNNPDALGLVERVLAALSRYDDETVHVDRTMGNASRIIRVPGTMNRKGTGTADRPHRRARLLHPPSNLQPVDVGLLETLAGPPTPPPTQTRVQIAGRPEYDVHRMLALVGRTRDRGVKDGTQIWEIEICPFDRDHNRYEATIGQRSDGPLWFNCPHDGCANENWDTLRAKLDPKPREATKRPTPTDTRTQPRQAGDGQEKPVGDPLALATQPDLFGGEEPTEFWGERPILRHIHESARASMTSPWAVLGRVLVRVVAATPPWLVLPAIVGRETSLNLYVAAVDPSGGGKSAAADVGEQLLHGAHGYIERPVGSGEGLVSLYMQARRINGSYTQEQYNTSAILTADEIGTLLALDQRAGATLGGFLRTAWGGRQLGNSYRDEQKNLVVGAHRYRLCLWTGAQPGLCAPLFAPVATAAGTPQRLVYLPAIDPHAPDETPDWPDPLIWTPPRWGDDPPPGVVRTIPVCTAARDEIRRARRAQLKGQDQRDPLDGHSLLNREKVAAALALLDGRLEITDDDWRLGALVMRISDHTRAGVLRSLQDELARNAKGKAWARAQEAIEIAESMDKRQLQKASQAIIRKLSRQPADDPWVSHRVLRTALDSTLRSVFDEAVAGLIEANLIMSEEVTISGNRGIRYRKV